MVELEKDDHIRCSKIATFKVNLGKQATMMQ